MPSRKKLTATESRLSRAEGELISLRARILEINHLMRELGRSQHITNITLAKRMDELINRKNRCEQEIVDLKLIIAQIQTVKDETAS